MLHHEYVEIEKIKENTCVEFFQVCEMLQNRTIFQKTSYKEIMPIMHISKARLQRVLNAIDRNWIYFKIERGYMLEVSNIVMSIDWSKRVYYQGKPAFHFRVKRYQCVF
jgi:hypothetical protein